VPLTSPAIYSSWETRPQPPDTLASDEGQAPGGARPEDLPLPHP
jgi:hypothetical protein